MLLRNQKKVWFGCQISCIILKLVNKNLIIVNKTHSKIPDLTPDTLKWLSYINY